MLSPEDLFHTRDSHANITSCTLPPWTAKDVVTKMNNYFGTLLRDELLERMAAEKLGFTKEMVKRWERALPLPKVCIPARSDARNEWGGRHTVVLAICWDNWGTVKENLKSRMDRH